MENALKRNLENSLKKPGWKIKITIKNLKRKGRKWKLFVASSFSAVFAFCIFIYLCIISWILIFPPSVYNFGWSVFCWVGILEGVWTVLWSFGIWWKGTLCVQILKKSKCFYKWLKLQFPKKYHIPILNSNFNQLCKSKTLSKSWII